MESILFEKQEASLCAQHALNMLLQGAYFSAVDLSVIAHELDARESSVLQQGMTSSHNMDDSGFFSVQVIAEALKVFTLDLTPLNSPAAARFRKDPTLGRAYICNLNEHWFAVRRLGLQWFTLNSLLSTPKLISDTYLSLFFAQLTNDGYSIFVVDGQLPSCTADEVLSKCPVDPALASRSEPMGEQHKQDPHLTRAITLSKDSLKQERDVDEAEPDLKQALETSRRHLDDDDLSLQQALRESMKEEYGAVLDDDDMERQLQTALQMSLADLPGPSSMNTVNTEDGMNTAIQQHTEQLVPDAPNTELSPSDNTAQIRKQREQFLKRFDN